MTDSNRLTIAGALCACLLAASPTPATAQSNTASAPDPAVWGLYTQLAGSSRQAAEGYTIRWHWSEPGRELIEEYIAPVTGKLRATDTITVGPTPGTLHFMSSALGGKEWNGTLQPDGSVVYVGTGLLKFHFKAVLAPDGAYEVLPIKLRDGVVVSVAEPNASNRYLVVDAPAQVAAVAAPPAPVQAAPVAAATTASAVNKPAESAAPPPQWGLLSKLIGTDYTVYKGTENASTMRFVWQVPGQSIRLQLLRGGAWVNDDIIERTDDPTVFRLIQTDGAVGRARSLADGRIVWKYPTGNTASWTLSGARLAIGQVTSGYKWFSYYFAETPEGQAALAAAGPEVYKLPYQDELDAATERENIERANSAAQDAELEADAAAKRSAWNAMASQNEQALADSLQNLNDTVADIEAQQRAAEQARALQQEAADSAMRQAEVENARRATERQEAMARQYEAQRQADEARRAAMSSTLPGAPTPAPSRPPASGANADASEHLMGFLGATCEEATRSAHRHFGEGSTFRVAHSRPDGSLCLVQVDMDSVIRGASGTASSQ